MAATTFGIPRRIEDAYRRAIGRFVASVIPRKSLEQTYEEWIAELTATGQRKDVIDGATSLAMQMMRWVNSQNAKSWREAAARSARPHMLYRALQQE